MSDVTRVALDAMGGDNAPAEIVKGAVEAVQKRSQKRQAGRADPGRALRGSGGLAAG